MKNDERRGKSKKEERKMKNRKEKRKKKKEKQQRKAENEKEQPTTKNEQRTTKNGRWMTMNDAHQQIPKRNKTMITMWCSPKRHAKLFRNHTLRFIDFCHVLGHKHDRVAQ